VCVALNKREVNSFKPNLRASGGVYEPLEDIGNTLRAWGAHVGSGSTNGAGMMAGEANAKICGTGGKRLERAER
jgi:hypothetical protein